LRFEMEMELLEGCHNGEIVISEQSEESQKEDDHISDIMDDDQFDLYVMDADSEDNS
jgi:hypothetical protein